MADNTEPSGDAQVTFKVRIAENRIHTITMAESAPVLELKTKLSGEDFENIPIERQRLIYSGRVMKNQETLESYKIKHNNTIHMVKSAASNPTQQNSASGPTPRTVPQVLSAGTNPNDPLTGLTGARFAGHQINLPGMDMFGPDGGMGPPMDEERVQRMMSDPNVQQTMNEALGNPDFVNMLIESNPMLRNMPNAREIITSPFMRQMMTNPQMMSQVMRMQRSMRGEDSEFPAPGATDTTPDAAAAGSGPGTDNTNQQQNPFAAPGARGATNISQLLQAMNGIGANVYDRPPGTNPETQGSQNTQTEGTRGAQDGQSGNAAANPFAALFPQGGNADNADNAGNAFGMNPAALQQMMYLLGGGREAGGGVPGVPAAPADNRPPEERYAEQLRQLNDMGFFDFDRNVAALRRSGGSVQGAIEHLLSTSD
ncbi:hypothetical protein QQS21_001248 [Conoideocrella luteorostrata]|uniref:Deubiquitination-protection protein dph1 n=1 Tax=Conoideocrella luteorostrata TaxID=1105319 RepID=A0AAJ0G3K1_9HYPO|nr:hypothetical protein QQS21_001248 [Conoideocrella luteorostrata]